MESNVNRCLALKFVADWTLKVGDCIFLLLAKLAELAELLSCFPTAKLVVLIIPCTLSILFVDVSFGTLIAPFLAFTLGGIEVIDELAPNCWL